MAKPLLETCEPQMEPSAPPAGWPTPRAAYVHVPFCRHHCGYCNFTVMAGRTDLQGAYLEALERELALHGSSREVDTLYIGGGTPTELALPHLRRLLELVRHWFPLRSAGEFTVEANPEDVQAELLGCLHQAGVNRLSLGVQSFVPEKLRFLERAHAPAEAKRAVIRAAEVIPNLSIDLIFGAAHETQDNWITDLTQAIDLPITHLSAYGLTYEKGAAFFGRLQRGALSELDEETQLRMYELTRERLAAAGIEQYEVSNYARVGFASRHNQAYWDGKGWYGVGPGAARFVDGVREVNHRSTTRYLRELRRGASPTAEADALSPRTWAHERLAFGLRQIRGVDYQGIAREAGIQFSELLEARLRTLARQGLLEIRSPILRLTRRGLLISDAILGELLTAY